LRNSSEANKLNFVLGIVKYRYVNTVKDLYEYYEHHPESWPQHLAIGALLRTIDNYWTQDIIGGGMTATELVVNDANGVRQVLFKELHEEAGIKPEHVSTMQGIGIVCSPNADIIILVETKLNVSRKQLAEIFLGKLFSRSRGNCIIDVCCCPCSYRRMKLLLSLGCPWG